MGVSLHFHLHLHLHQVTLSGRIPSRTTDPAARCVGMEAVEIQGHVHVHQIAVFQGSQVLQNGTNKKAGWWFQPIWKILVKLEIFPK